MPIKFQIKKFLEQADNFNTIAENMNKIRSQNSLNHFINGALWKSKLSAFSEDQIVIPYHLYCDEAQMNNVLGTHCIPGLQNCVYFSFPTTPVQYASRLQNIFVGMLSCANHTKIFGADACFEHLISELNSLAQEGIEITVDGKKETVHFVLGLFLGDNASLNNILGFCTFSSTFFCKHCRLEKQQTQTATVEITSEIRNVENYEEDLATADEKQTGIIRRSRFNDIYLFHVVHSAGVDVMHDLSEGVLRYHMCSIIRHFVKKKVFTLKTLNSRKRNFAYNYADRGNKSSDITMTNLRKGRIPMTASEMMTFVQNFGFLVGDLVPAENEVWKFYLKTVEVVDLVYLTSYTDFDLVKLKNSISEMNGMYQSIFEKTLKPKHHILTHYPRLTKLFGPLRFISSLRYEAKHRLLKKYSKNTESRRNLSYSIGRKVQYSFANDINAQDGLKDKLEYQKPKKIMLSSQGYFNRIENSMVLDGLSHSQTMEVETLTMNGIHFSNELLVPEMDDTNMAKLLKIRKIFVFSENGQYHPYLLCSRYSYSVPCTHYAGYEITELNPGRELLLKSVRDLLETHLLPISTYSFNGKEVFRLRIH